MFTRRKLGVPCLKILSTVPKIWRAVPIFLARVNGVSRASVFAAHLWWVTEVQTSAAH